MTTHSDNLNQSGLCHPGSNKAILNDFLEYGYPNIAFGLCINVHECPSHNQMVDWTIEFNLYISNIADACFQDASISHVDCDGIFFLADPLRVPAWYGLLAVSGSYRNEYISIIELALKCMKCPSVIYDDLESIEQCIFMADGILGDSEESIRDRVVFLETVR